MHLGFPPMKPRDKEKPIPCRPLICTQSQVGNKTQGPGSQGVWDSTPKQPGPWREFQSSRSFTSFHSWRSGLPQTGVEPATTYLPSVSQRFNSLLMGSTFQTNPIDREHTVTYKEKAGRTSSMKCIWHTETFKSQLIRTASEVTSPSLHTLSQEENFATKPYGWTQWS